jgi:hypothetical protein
MAAAQRSGPGRRYPPVDYGRIRRQRLQYLPQLDRMTLIPTPLRRRELRLHLPPPSRYQAPPAIVLQGPRRSRHRLPPRPLGRRPPIRLRRRHTRRRRPLSTSVHLRPQRLPHRTVQRRSTHRARLLIEQCRKCLPVNRRSPPAQHPREILRPTPPAPVLHPHRRQRRNPEQRLRRTRHETHPQAPRRRHTVRQRPRLMRRWQQTATRLPRKLNRRTPATRQVTDSVPLTQLENRVDVPGIKPDRITAGQHGQFRPADHLAGRGIADPEVTRSLRNGEGLHERDGRSTPLKIIPVGKPGLENRGTVQDSAAPGPVLSGPARPFPGAAPAAPNR